MLQELVEKNYWYKLKDRKACVNDSVLFSEDDPRDWLENSIFENGTEYTRKEIQTIIQKIKTKKPVSERFYYLSYYQYHSYFVLPNNAAYSIGWFAEIVKLVDFRKKVTITTYPNNPMIIQFSEGYFAISHVKEPISYTELLEELQD